MKTSLLLLTTLLAMTDVPSGWEKRDQKILISNAQLHKVNYVQMETEPRSLSFFTNAKIKTKKINPNEKYLILDQAKVRKPPYAFIQFVFDSEKGNFSIDTKAVVEKLRALNAGLPKGDLAFLPDGTEMLKARDAKTNHWYLLPKALLKSDVMVPMGDKEQAQDQKEQAKQQAPKAEQEFTVKDGVLSLNGQALNLEKMTKPILSSALLEWGESDPIQSLRDSLYVKGKEKDEVLGTKLYDKHYVKIPFQVSLYNSDLADDSDKATKEGEPLDEMFLIRHRLRQDGPGYLWVKKDIDGKSRLFLIEVPVFHKDTSGYKFEIPARCFIDFVATKKLKASDLKCDIPAKGNEFEAINACKSVPGKTEKDPKQLRIVGTFPTNYDKDTDKPVTFWLKANKGLDQYTVLLEPGEDGVVDIPPDENVYVVDAAQCKPTALFPKTDSSTGSIPKTK